jgi:hypothetical protein
VAPRSPSQVVAQDNVARRLPEPFVSLAEAWIWCRRFLPGATTERVVNRWPPLLVDLPGWWASEIGIRESRPENGLSSWHGADVPRGEP